MNKTGINSIFSIFISFTVDWNSVVSTVGHVRTHLCSSFVFCLNGMKWFVFFKKIKISIFFCFSIWNYLCISLKFHFKQSSFHWFSSLNNQILIYFIPYLNKYKKKQKYIYIDERHRCGDIGSFRRAWRLGHAAWTAGETAVAREVWLDWWTSNLRLYGYMMVYMDIWWFICVFMCL